MENNASEFFDGNVADEYVGNDEESVEIAETAVNMVISVSEQMTLQDKLGKWYRQFQPTRSSVNGVLHILNSENIKVPNSFDDLLCRGKETTTITTVSAGTYYHLDLTQELLIVSERDLQNTSSISLDIGVDGLPLFKSSSTADWPIMAKNVHIDVFSIGCFVGYKKSFNVDNYLHDFVNETKSVIENGIELHGRNINIKIRAFICDI